MKKIVFLIKPAPYGMATAAEGFRAIIATAGMGIETHAVLVEDGVFVAKTGQQPGSIAMQKLETAYNQLSDFGATLYIHKESAEERGLDEKDTIPARWISLPELKNLIQTSDFVVSFS